LWEQGRWACTDLQAYKREPAMSAAAQDAGNLPGLQEGDAGLHYEIGDKA
jgi:hypothetical protein